MRDIRLTDLARAAISRRQRQNLVFAAAFAGIASLTACGGGGNDRAAPTASAGSVQNAPRATKSDVPAAGGDASASPAQTRSMLMVHYIYTDTPSCYTSTEHMRQTYFDGQWSVKNYFKDSSYGKFTWTGDVLMCQLDYASTDDSHDSTADCQALARSQGYDPDSYDTWGSISNTGGAGGSSGNTAGAGNCEMGYIIHELGHQAGLGHSSSDWDDDGVIDDEYGNHADVMGWGWGSISAPWRVSKGWLTPAAITANGTYKLAPIEESSGVRAYVFNPPTGDPYYFDYRQPIGFDGQDIAADGTPKPEGAIGSTPYTEAYTTGVNLYHGFNRIVGQLTDGQTYNIRDTSIVIRQDSHDSSGVTFTVSGFPAPAPTPSCSYVTWVDNHNYTKGTIVKYPANGKYYKLVRVGRHGSDGTDPTISTWYWQPTTCN